jgi:hypothetical protein
MNEEEHCCPQCGFAFVTGEPIAIMTQFCPYHGWEHMTVHAAPCLQDFMGGEERKETRNKQISMRRLN